jgi:hypothetical protein
LAHGRIIGGVDMCVAVNYVEFLRHKQQVRFVDTRCCIC